MPNSKWSTECWRTPREHCCLAQTEGEIISSAQENINEQWVCITARPLLPSRGNLLNTDFISKWVSLEEIRTQRSLLKRQRNITWQMSSPEHMATFPLIPPTTHSAQTGSRSAHLWYILKTWQTKPEARSGRAQRGPGPSDQPWIPWAYIPSRPLWWL